MSETKFYRGDRVRLSEEQMTRWSPCNAEYSNGGYFGTVAATPRKGYGHVSVRWDGRAPKSLDRIPFDWLEKGSDAHGRDIVPKESHERIP